MGDLLGSNALEIAIGLIFMFFLLSLVCSSINEFLAGLLKWRARDLVNGLINLLGDPNVVQRLLNHPLVSPFDGNLEAQPVRSLGGEKSYNLRGAQSNAVIEGTPTPGTPPAAPNPIGKITVCLDAIPSYIPARTFSLTFLDAVMNNPGSSFSLDDVRQQAISMINSTGPENAAKRDLGKSLLAMITDSQRQPLLRVADFQQWVQHLPDSPDKNNLLANLNPTQSLEEARNIVLTLMPGPVQQTALQWLSNAEDELAKLRTSIETWFDNAMEHLSEVYKRRIKLYLFLIGCIVVLLTGADTFRMVRAFSTNSTLRSIAVAEANRIVEQGGAIVTPTLPITTTLQPTPVSTTSTTSQLTTTAAITSTATPSPLPELSDIVSELNLFSELFGYGDVEQKLKSNQGFWDLATFGLAKFLGLLITAIALSFGAPFWFDLLSRVSDLRAAKKPTPQPDARTG